jgi:hypothetical protein
VEDEQQGNAKASYGKSVLKTLAHQLTTEFGAGFDDSNLRNMRQFYLAFPIRDALRHELSWTHYRLICRVPNADQRTQYVLLRQPLPPVPARRSRVETTHRAR